VPSSNTGSADIASAAADRDSGVDGVFSQGAAVWRPLAPALPRQMDGLILEAHSLQAQAVTAAR
jgi:hypothetical protein